MKFQEQKLAIKKIHDACSSAFLFLAFVCSILLFFGLIFVASTTAQTPSPATNAAIKSTPDLDTNFPSSEPSTPSPENYPPVIAENLIHFGDKLEVDILGSLEYDWRGKADDEGFLSSLPYLDVSIQALCRTEREVAAEIAEAYGKFLRDPQVVVRVLDRSDRQNAVMFGAVRSPHRFQIQRPVRLNELVILSGGITDQASGEVEIFRPAMASCTADKQTQTESQLIRIKLADLLAGKAEANPFVKAGDVVTVEEATPIYVTGGIVVPQRILFRAGMTVSRAVASAGGLSQKADPTKIIVFRRQKDRAELEIIETDLDKIKQKTADDIALQPFDIVEVSHAGRERNRRPPIISQLESAQTSVTNLPVRVIS
jgi:protein involved in polysaccharide export with SLBB domain